MNVMMKNAFLFPGQGAQYPGMGHDFYKKFPIAKETFQEADEILNRSLSKIIFEGPEEILTETKNSQIAIYVVSMAILRIIEKEFPNIKPTVCSGLSLGEYTAATAAGILEFSECLQLVQHRGQYMNDACESTNGTMSVIIGLGAEQVEKMVQEINLPNDLWTANFNCPGQVVISGTLKGIQIGTQAAKSLGSKRVLPLKVHGAFHSGLMEEAKVRLEPHILNAKFQESGIGFVMNVPGDYVKNIEEIKKNLIEQITHPVRWEQGIRKMEMINTYIEIGPGKSLTGMNKRIKVLGNTINVEKVEDLDQLEKATVG